MAFTYDLADDVGKVRLLISDSDVTSFHFTDAEIEVFLAMASNSLLIAAGYALESWAASITDSLLSEKIGDYSYTKKDAEAKISLAKEYKKQAAEFPAFEWSEIDLTCGSGITAEED